MGSLAWLAFTEWGDAWAIRSPAVVTVQSGGGGTLHLPTGRRRSKEELQAERERFGILPAAQTVVIRKARKVAPEVIEAALDRELAFERIRQTQEDELVLALLMH